MSDYIDRQQAIDAVGKEPYVADIDGAPTRVYLDVDVMWELYHLPSAQPKIIRCKDCKHYADRWFTYPMCMIDARAVNTDDFCSYGERGKNNETD